MDMEMETESEMEFEVARDLVRRALDIVLTRPPIGPDATLEDLGLSTPATRRHFRMVLTECVQEMGYEINPDDIPDDPTDTPRIIASVLPGRSTKRNPH